MKRVFAWILLIGFVLLVLNILTFQFFLTQSIFVYIIVIVIFLFTNKPMQSKKNSEKEQQ